MDEWPAARQELVHSLEEYGVRGNQPTHVQFRQRVFREAEQMCKVRASVPKNYNQLLKTNNFPTDYEEAVEFVFRSEIEEEVEKNNLFLVEDMIHKDSNQPWYRKYADIKNRPTQYRLKPEFKQVNQEHLDPFRRFWFYPCSESMYWYNRWFESTLDADAGTIFEARFACYALQHQTCYSCHCRKSLRWCGGSKASWQDLVCIVCKSTYELKTKANMEKIEQNFDRNSIRGGSYSRYCELRNSGKKGPDEKMFLVMLPREYTINRNREKCHPVFIAEVDTVLPQLGPTSFHPDIKPMRLASKVSVKMLTKRHWFDLPKTEPIYYVNIMKKLFIEKFSEEELERLDQLNVSTDQSEPVQSPSIKLREESNKEVESINESKNDDVERLKEELQNMKVGDDAVDDWEDMF